MSTATYGPIADGDRERTALTFFSKNPGKRAAEKWYLVFFLLTLPVQTFVNRFLSYTHPNDLLLGVECGLMALAAWSGSLVFRAKADKGLPFYEVYGFKLGCFVAIWAFVGGYLGTDPWYEVLHGHYAFNTEFNPSGTPFFMLPMTMVLYAAYVTVLGIIFRVLWWAYQKVRIPAIPNFLAKALLFLPIAAMMPVVETFYFVGPNFCFDRSAGQFLWFLNILLDGSWHYAALWFYVDFDEYPGVRQPWIEYIVKGFATVGILLMLTHLISEYIAPRYTTVERGARHLNDWSVDNCLGPKPGT